MNVADGARGKDEGEDEGTGERSESARDARLTALILRRKKLTDDEAALLGAEFSGMIRAHHTLVWERLRRRGLDQEEAEDLLQETFAELYAHLLSEGFPASVPKLLQNIARFKLLNHLRSRRRSPMTLRLPSSSSEKPPSAQEMERVLDLRALYPQLFGALSPEHQEVVEKVILNGMSQVDAAEVLGIPESTLKARLIAAKKKLLSLAKALLPPSQQGES